MASYLRPRRGSFANAKSQLTASNPLKSGEVFFECENIGKSQGKIKLGDATTTYSSLPYFLSMQDSSIGFTDVTGSNSTAESTILGNIKPSSTHSSVIQNIKQLLWNHSSKITAINTSIGNINTSLSTLTTKVNTNTTNITNLTTKVNTNTTNITNLTTKVDTNTSNITSLTTKVNTNTTNITSLTAKVNISWKRIVLLSGSTGFAPTGGAWAQITLTESIDNFAFIQLYTLTSPSNAIAYTCLCPVSGFKTTTVSNPFVAGQATTQGGSAIYVHYIDSTHIAYNVFGGLGQGGMYGYGA